MAIDVSVGDLGLWGWLGAIAWLVLPLVLLVATVGNRLVRLVTAAVLILVELADFGVLVGVAYGEAAPTRMEALLLYGLLAFVVCGAGALLERGVTWFGRWRAARAWQARLAQPVLATVGAAGAPAEGGEVLVGELVDEQVPSTPSALGDPPDDAAERAFAAAVALGRPVRRLSRTLSVVAVSSIFVIYYIAVGAFSPRLFTGFDRALILPLPSGLSIVEQQPCSSGAERGCLDALVIGAADNASGTVLTDRVVAHLHERGFESSGGDLLCRTPGWVLGSRACVVIGLPKGDQVTISLDPGA